MLKIEYIDIKEIKPYENNPRDNKNAIKSVAKSIERYGFKVPVLINTDNIIISGHTRYEASKILKIKKIPCIKVENLTDEKINLFRVIDNKSSEYSYWDYNKLNIELLELKEKNIILDDFEYRLDALDEENIINSALDEYYEDIEDKLYECPYCHCREKKERFKKL